MYDMNNLKKLGDLGKNAEAAMKAFQGLDQAALADGAIPKKYKELIAVAVALTTQCPYCLEIHKKHAEEAGATQEELAEVTFVAAALRAGAMNKENTATYIIVGAGLSGLTSAYEFMKQEETNFLVLESRNRIGGRIMTKNGIDFGAAWFQNHHQNVIDLVDDLDLQKFHQYSKGKSVLVYNSMAPAHFFESDPNAPAAYRIAGGSDAMIRNLAKDISEKIRTNTVVTELIETPEGVTLVTTTGNYYAKKVILAIPPRIATRVSYTPELSEATLSAMENTHTWMSNAIKVGLTFKTAFWREKKMSGTLIGQVGAVTELYDHNSLDGETFSLMGKKKIGQKTNTPHANKLNPFI